MKNLSKILFSAALITAPTILKAQTNTAEQIKQVENNLFGRVQIVGEKPWNLADRMAFTKFRA